VYDRPIAVPQNLGAAEIEAYRLQIEQRLNRLTYQVDRWVTAENRTADPRDIPIPASMALG
jgi:hypothetical protein